jgi:hypothetical protein
MLFRPLRPAFSREDGRAERRSHGEHRWRDFVFPDLVNLNRTNEAEMTMQRTLPLPLTPAHTPRAARPAYAVPAWGKVRPSSRFATPAGGFGLAPHRGSRTRTEPGTNGLEGRIGRDGQDTRIYQRGSSGVVYAMV